MSVKFRLIFAAAACCFLSSCGLIGTALRLAPYALLFADEEGRAPAAGKTLEMRGKEVQGRGNHGAPRFFGSDAAGSRVALSR